MHYYIRIGDVKIYFQTLFFVYRRCNHKRISMFPSQFHCIIAHDAFVTEANLLPRREHDFQKHFVPASSVAYTRERGSKVYVNVNQLLSFMANSYIFSILNKNGTGPGIMCLSGNDATVNTG